MSAPRFEPTDAYDLLQLVANVDSPNGRNAVDLFLAACQRDAMAHDGLVLVNRVRVLMAGAQVEHHRYSALWSRFTGQDRPMRKATVEDVAFPWETCEGSPSGNGGRPYRLRRWAGTR